MECVFLPFFSLPGDRYFYINDVNTQVEFKSRQWFGATVRSHGNRILVRKTERATRGAHLPSETSRIFNGELSTSLLAAIAQPNFSTFFFHFKMRGVLFASQACAPRYYWRTEHNTPFADVTGTCFLSVDSLNTFVEFAPCRTGELLQRPNISYNNPIDNTQKGQDRLHRGNSAQNSPCLPNGGGHAGGCFSFHSSWLFIGVPHVLCCSLQNGMDLLARAIVRGALVQTSPR